MIKINKNALKENTEKIFNLIIKVTELPYTTKNIIFNQKHDNKNGAGVCNREVYGFELDNKNWLEYVKDPIKDQINIYDKSFEKPSMSYEGKGSSFKKVF